MTAVDWLRQRCQLPACGCPRPGPLFMLLVMVSSCFIYPVLRSAGLQLHSAFTGSYISGTHSVAFINCPNEQVARDIARWDCGVLKVPQKILVVSSFVVSTNIIFTWRAIMERKLAASVNILSKSASLYIWKGEIEEATEILLVSSSL
ncbi:protein CutA homolog isoform X3 [Ambystoma mexicanum]|uniref:protein CutA homolog isoform X3 n=1 Tax=Ambystoma mexicanum TaxID=8296 RepID=UPI0037E86C86